MQQTSDEVLGGRVLTDRERTEARLAAALRENLRKRRQQRTARAESQTTPSNAE